VRRISFRCVFCQILTGVPGIADADAAAYRLLRHFILIKFNVLTQGSTDDGELRRVLIRSVMMGRCGTGNHAVGKAGTRFFPEESREIKGDACIFKGEAGSARESATQDRHTEP
jgi:hypothetical protein